MTSLQTLLNRIKELDEKRTPGEWRKYVTQQMDGTYIVSVNGFEIVANTSQDDQDAQFIATLANECAKLVKIIEVQNEALKSIRECAVCDRPEDYCGPAEDALEQAEKIAEGSE